MPRKSSASDSKSKTKVVKKTSPSKDASTDKTEKKSMWSKKPGSPSLKEMITQGLIAHGSSGVGVHYRTLQKTVGEMYAKDFPDGDIDKYLTLYLLNTLKTLVRMEYLVAGGTQKLNFRFSPATRKELDLVAKREKEEDSDSEEEKKPKSRGRSKSPAKKSPAKETKAAPKRKRSPSPANKKTAEKKKAEPVTTKRARRGRSASPAPPAAKKDAFEYESPEKSKPKKVARKPPAEKKAEPAPPKPVKGGRATRAAAKKDASPARAAVPRRFTPAPASPVPPKSVWKMPELKDRVAGGPSAIDLCFVVDCTGSMGSYIRSAQENIQRIVYKLFCNEGASIRFSLVAFRDHPPQESSYVTQVHPFTEEIDEMQTYVNTMAAVGGGDAPEAMSAALADALKLDWREHATKLCVLITDAPPHGLIGAERGDQIPDGCPLGTDPIKSANAMIARGIMLFAIPCEPAIGQNHLARDLMQALADITEGKCISLENAELLADVVIASAREEINLDMYLAPVVTEEVEKLKSGAEGSSSSQDDLIARVTQILKDRNVLVPTMKIADERERYPTPYARFFEAASSLPEAVKAANEFSKRPGSPATHRAYSFFFSVPAADKTPQENRKVVTSMELVSEDQVNHMYQKLKKMGRI